MRKIITRPVIIIALLFILITLIVRNSLSSAVVPPQPLPQTTIVDSHIHIAGLGYGSDSFISAEMKKNYKFDYYLKAFGVTREQLKQHGDQIIVRNIAALVKQSKHVDSAVILAMDGVIDKHGRLDKAKTQVYIPNDFVAEQSARYPSLHFGASINPYRPDAIARLKEAKMQGAVLIKWIPNIQYIDPADKQLIPFYKAMQELKLPLLSHAGQERAFSAARDSLGDPLRLKLPLSLGVTVIAAHIATTGENEKQDNYQRLLTLFDDYPNLYADISSLTQINKLGYLNTALLEEKLENRLIYGSDFPLTNTILVSPYYFPLNLTFKQMRQISAINNPLDRDIALKQALGVSAAIFSRSANLLNIPVLPGSQGIVLP